MYILKQDHLRAVSVLQWRMDVDFGFNTARVIIVTVIIVIIIIIIIIIRQLDPVLQLYLRTWHID